MSKQANRIIAAAIFAAGIAAAMAPSSGATFFAWQIAGVGAGDLLNVRAYPSSGSKVLVGYPNGTVLSMTGRCTGGVDIDGIAGMSSWKQRQAVRYKWCEAWLDPNGSGEFRNGWVYGRYIQPD